MDGQGELVAPDTVDLPEGARHGTGGRDESYLAYSLDAVRRIRLRGFNENAFDLWNILGTQNA